MAILRRSLRTFTSHFRFLCQYFGKISDSISELCYYAGSDKMTLTSGVFEMNIQQVVGAICAVSGNQLCHGKQHNFLGLSEFRWPSLKLAKNMKIKLFNIFD